MGTRRRLPIVLPRSRAAIERLAEQFLAGFAPERLRIPGPVAVVQALDCVLPRQYGFAVDVDGALPEGVAAVTDFEMRKVVVSPEVYAGSERGEPAGRFTLMHEIGHVVTIGAEMESRLRLRRLTGLSAQPVARRGSLAAFEDPEWQADAFAAAALMPRRPFARAAREPGAGSREVLATLFGVTPDAVHARRRVLRRRDWL